MRALADYRKANKSAREVAALFSTGRDDAPQLAAQMVEENKELNRRIRALEEIAAEAEAEKLLATASNGVVTQVFDGRDAESLKKLAHALIANPKQSPCSALAIKTRRALSSHAPQTLPAT